VKLTDGGRTVYGGAGSSDVKLALTSQQVPDSLLQHYALFNFAQALRISQRSLEFRSGPCVLLDSQFLDSKKSLTGAGYRENEWLRSNIRANSSSIPLDRRGLKVRRNRSGCDQGSGPDAASARSGDNAKKVVCANETRPCGYALSKPKLD